MKKYSPFGKNFDAGGMLMFCSLFVLLGALKSPEPIIEAICAIVGTAMLLIGLEIIINVRNSD